MRGEYEPGLRGRPVDASRCMGRVTGPDVWSGAKQCTHAPKPGSKWCGVHDPEKAKRKDIERNARWKREAYQAGAGSRNAARTKQERDIFEAALLEIADDAAGEAAHAHATLFRVADLRAKWKAEDDEGIR